MCSKRTTHIIVSFLTLGEIRNPFSVKQILIRLLCTNVTRLGSAPVRRNHWMVFLICLQRSELQPVIKGLRKLLLIIVVFWMQAWLTASIPSYQQAVSASMLTLRLVKLSESTPCGIVYTWKLVGLISFSTAFCSHCGETLLWQPYAIEWFTCNTRCNTGLIAFLISNLIAFRLKCEIILQFKHWPNCIVDAVV